MHSQHRGTQESHLVWVGEECLEKDNTSAPPGKMSKCAPRSQQGESILGRGSHVSEGTELDRAHDGTRPSLCDWRIQSVGRGVASDIMNILGNYTQWLKMGTEINSYHFSQMLLGHGQRCDQTRMIYTVETIHGNQDF